MKAYELTNFLDNLPIKKNCLQGIVNISNLPEKVGINRFLIVYLPVTETHGHWITLHRHRHFIEIFDSLVLSEFQSDKISKHFNIGTLKNFHAYQPKESILCGVFCMFYIYNRYFNSDLTFGDFLQEFFSLTKEENEKTIVNFAKQYK